MKYDFTTIMNRKGEDALAVDAVGQPGFAPKAPEGDFDFIPMWVADMNFPVLPAITDAIIERTTKPHFGYFRPRDAYFQSIIDWQRDRNDVEGLEAKHIGYENGVLGGVLTALRVICPGGGDVLVHSPTYIGFTHSLHTAGYHIVHSPLKQDEAGIYRMDLQDMEAKLKDGHIHAAIFCSPHNPTGRVWTREEMEAVSALYAKYQVYVICDEIWSDIILDGHRHIPFQSISEDARQRTVALYAPSKTFNLAGLIGSYHIVYNDYLRDSMVREAARTHYNEMNVLSMHALIGGYGEEGRIWVDELRQTITGNVDFAVDYINSHFEGVKVTKPEGTYMLFIDCTDWCRAHGKDVEDVLNAGWRVGVGWQDGRPFHGPCHIRMNLALPLDRVKEAFARLDQYVF